MDDTFTKKQIDEFERYVADAEAQLQETLRRNGVTNYPRCRVVDAYELRKLQKKAQTEFDASRYMMGADGSLKENTNGPAAPIKFEATSEGIYNYSDQFTLDDYLLGRHLEGKPKRTTEFQSATCVHDWKLYQGLLHDDYYCTKCGQTRPLNPKA